MQDQECCERPQDNSPRVLAEVLIEIGKISNANKVGEDLLRMYRRSVKELEGKLSTAKTEKAECEKALLNSKSVIASLNAHLEQYKLLVVNKNSEIEKLEDGLNSIRHSADTTHENLSKLKNAVCRIQNLRSLTKAQRDQIKKILLY